METLEAGQAYLALPESGRGAGIVLLHPWWGLNDFMKATADRLAAEGFVVLAPDLYDGTVVTTIEDAEAASNALDFDHAVELMNQSVDFLAAHPAVQGSALGVVGFSMGAGFALWLANQQPDVIAAVVVFYGTYGGGDLSQMRAAFQGHFAETDPFEPREEVENSIKCSRGWAWRRPSTSMKAPDTGSSKLTATPITPKAPASHGSGRSSFCTKNSSPPAEDR